MRCAVLLVALLAVSSSAYAQDDLKIGQGKLWAKFEEALNSVLHRDHADTKRKLLSWTPGAGAGKVQDFFSGMMGANWTDYLPTTWAHPSFTWESLGQFEYSSNMGDFIDAVKVQNITKPQSLHELHNTMNQVTSAFCTPEKFVAPQKVYATCVGPTVTLAYAPKVCILDEETKQVICDPAKLVLIKTPGGCTHKYTSPSVWKGQECKIQGGAGISKDYVYGGRSYVVPMPSISASYEP